MTAVSTNEKRPGCEPPANPSVHIATAGLIDAPEDMSYWDAPFWREAAIEYHRDRPRGPAIEPERLALLRRLMADDVSLERAWHELSDNRPTPQTTIEAICYAVRQQGLDASKSQPNGYRTAMQPRWLRSTSVSPSSRRMPADEFSKSGTLCSVERHTPGYSLSR